METETPLDISFVIPAYNEALGLPTLFKTMGAIHDFIVASPKIGACEFIIVDDGSTDASLSYLRETVYPVPFSLICASHDTNYGYGAALQSGVHLAQYTWIVTFDADGQHDASAIIAVLKEAVSSKRFLSLIGCRLQNKKPSFRNLAKAVLNWSERFLLAAGIRDSNSGLKMFHKPTFSEIEKILPPPSDMSFSQYLALTFQAIAKNAVKEVEIEVQERKTGHSKVQLRDFCLALRQNITLALLLRPRRLGYLISALFMVSSILYSFAVIMVNKAGVPVAGIILMLIAMFFAILGELRQSLGSSRLARLERLTRVDLSLKIVK